jgi:hypothetical protein
MFGKNLGNAVASEMEAVLNSNEYKHLFSKEAEAKCACPKSCDCWEKLGEHGGNECGCKDQDEKEAKKKANIDVESLSLQDSFDNLVQKFVSLSEELDELGFDKASASLLSSFDILLKEAAGEPIEEMLEETLRTVRDMGPNVELDVDIDEKQPVVEEVGADERLMEDEGGFDWDATFKALDEMGLGGETTEGELSEEDKGKLKELGLIEKATKEVEEWLKKNASAEDLDQESTVDFELDADLSALLAEDTLDGQLVSIAEDEDEEDEDEEDEDDCLQADDEDEDEEFEDEE